MQYDATNKHFYLFLSGGFFNIFAYNLESDAEV